MVEEIILKYFKHMNAEDQDYSRLRELNNVLVEQYFSGACLEEVSNKFIAYNRLSDYGDLIKSQLEWYMVHPNIERLSFSFLVQVLPKGMSLDTSGCNYFTKLEWTRQSVHI